MSESLFRFARILRVALLAGRIAFRNKLIARGCGLLFIAVGYIVDVKSRLGGEISCSWC